MSLNRSLLTAITKDLEKKKKPSKPRVPKNQWQHPGEITKIPSNNITMQGVSYPVLGVPNVGEPQMMYPDQDYHFPGAGNVVEYPMMGSGGEMIRRADGSYSQRGLWDNIRANKGSGKKPTREMLEQERRIKAEMAHGGTTYSGGLWYDDGGEEMQIGGLTRLAGRAARFLKNEPAAGKVLGYAPEEFTPSMSDSFKNLINGVKSRVYDKTVYPLKHGSKIRATDKELQSLMRDMDNPESRRRLTEMGVDTKRFFEPVNVSKSSMVDTRYDPMMDHININYDELAEAGKLATKGNVPLYNLTTRSTLAHELGHRMQALKPGQGIGQTTPFSHDEVLDFLQYKKGLKPFGQRVKDYFLEAKKNGELYATDPHLERTPHLMEMKEDMLQAGLLKNRTADVSADVINKFVKMGTRNRVANLIEPDMFNYYELGKLMNKLPATAPVLGTGALLMNQNRKNGGSTFSGNVWYEDGGELDQYMQTVEETERTTYDTKPIQSVKMKLPEVNKPALPKIEPVKVQQKPTFNQQLGNVYNTLAEEQTNPYSMTNVLRMGNDILEGFQNQADYNAKLDKRRMENSSDQRFQVQGPSETSRGVYDMYNQFMPNKVGGNMSYMGMNPQFADGGSISDFDMISDIATVPFNPFVSLMMNHRGTAQTDATRVARPATPRYFPASSPDTSDIAEIIATKESNGNYGALPKKINGKLPSSAVGKYQFLWDKHGKEISRVTGVTSKESFRNNPEAQEKFFDHWNASVLTPVAERLKRMYRPDMSIVDLKKLIHFQGADGATRYLKTGKYTTDAYGSTPATYLASKAEGGEVEMTQEELDHFLRMGGQVEYC